MSSSSKQQQQQQQRFRYRTSSWLILLVVGILTVAHIYKYSTIFQLENRNLGSGSAGKHRRQQQQSWKQTLEEDDLIHDICTGPLRRHLETNFTSSSSSSSLITNNRHDEKDDESDDDYNWVIIMTVNDGFYDFFQNWYLHYIELNLNLDILLFAEDRTVYHKLSNLKLPNVNVIMTDTANAMSNSTTDAMDFRNPDYKKLVSYRPSRVLNFLCSTGRNAIYVDVDTVWLKNPLPYLQPQPQKQQHGDEHFQVETPLSYRLKVRTDPDLSKDDKKSDITMTVDKKDNLCTALIAIRCNRRTIQFVSKWEQSMNEKLKMDQYVFNGVYKDMYLSSVVSQQQDSKNEKDVVDDDIIALNGLPQHLFPNGLQYFNKRNKKENSDETNEEDNDDVVQVHANWIIGHEDKKAQLIKHNLWKVKE